MMDSSAIDNESEALSAIYGSGDFEDETYSHPVVISGVECIRRFIVRNIVISNGDASAVAEAEDDEDDDESGEEGGNDDRSGASCKLMAKFYLPQAYPASQPPVLVLDTESFVPSGRLEELAKVVVSKCYNQGCECCYDCAEMLRSGGYGDEDVGAVVQQLLEDLSSTSRLRRQQSSASGGEGDRKSDVEVPPIVEGEVETVKKSKFVAFAAIVHTEEEADAFRDHLLQDKRIAAATHNMFAYRIKRADGTLVEKRDEDGEHGAGDKMLYLLTALGEVETAIIVSRWYGGVHLGHDRFKIIVRVARDVLEGDTFGALRTMPRERITPAYGSAKRNLH